MSLRSEPVNPSCREGFQEKQLRNLSFSFKAVHFPPFPCFSHSSCLHTLIVLASYIELSLSQQKTHTHTHIQNTGSLVLKMITESVNVWSDLFMKFCRSKTFLWTYNTCHCMDSITTIHSFTQELTWENNKQLSSKSLTFQYLHCRFRKSLLHISASVWTPFLYAAVSLRLPQHKPPSLWLVSPLKQS